MSVLPESPRRRRRLFWLTLVVLVAAATAGTIMLLPGSHPPREVFSNQPAQLAVTGQARLTPADRRRVGAAVDRFLVAALDRRDPATAWALAGPDLRGSSTAADWVAGNMPLPRYAAKGTHFGGWTLVDIQRQSVSFNLIVQPRAAGKTGALALSMELVRRGRSWVVNRAYPVASFTPVGEKPHVVGPADFGAAGRAAAVDHGTLAGTWIVVPVALFLVGLLAVGLILSRNWLRYRRARRAFTAAGASAIPTLPQSYRDGSSSGSSD